MSYYHTATRKASWVSDTLPSSTILLSYPTTPPPLLRSHLVPHPPSSNPHVTSLPPLPIPLPLPPLPQDPSWCQSVQFLPYGCASRGDPQWAEAIELMDRDLRWLLTLDHAQFWIQVERDCSGGTLTTHLLFLLTHISAVYVLNLVKWSLRYCVI